MTVKKYHVKLSWKVESNHAFAPIFASDEEQASEIAILKLKQSRSDFDKMIDVTTVVKEC